MADRTSAYLFSTIFTLLANDTKPLDREAMARELWNIARSYDFSPCQLECNEVLGKLGLAYRGVDKDYPEDGEVWIYKE